MAKNNNRTKRKKPTTLLEALGLQKTYDMLFHNERFAFALGLALCAVAILLTIAMWSYLGTGGKDASFIESLKPGELNNPEHEFVNKCGPIGAYTAYFLVKCCFGYAAFIIPLFLAVLGSRMMQVHFASMLKWFVCSSVLMVWSSVAMSLCLEPLDIHNKSWFSAGGDHGMFICNRLEGYIGLLGLIVLLAAIALIFLTYISAEVMTFIRICLNPVKYWSGKVPFTVNQPKNADTNEAEDEQESSDPQIFDNPDTQQIDFGVNDGSAIVNIGHFDEQPKKDDKNGKPGKSDGNGEETFEIAEGVEVEKPDGSELVKDDKELGEYDPKKDLEFYKYPTLDLLKKYDDDGKPYIDMAEQKANKDRIVEVLHSFGVEISSIRATVGPTITLYEITPASGVRISKIRNLEDDIALSLSALGIRIIAPIPGKGTIGIEVPNAKPSIVSMESILNSRTFQETKMELPCAVGKTITNEVYMFDLAKIPHLLVAGATGQGKSVGLNAIITSLLYKKHPAELKIVLIDPKKVEFSVYSNLEKHFLAKVPDDDEEPIITDVTKVIRTLNSLCKEMDDRYDLLKAAGARNIKEYNQKFINRQLNPEKGHRFLPYIVVVIDEFGDLIMTAGKEIELPIARIAQLARAIGIHMVIATQRPTTTIITGNIKANFPGRMAFKVSAMIDSRTVLDRPGANQLIGRGDMLILNGSEPVRVQCAFVDTPEVERINTFISEQQGYIVPYELPEPLVADGEGGGGNDVDLNHLDPFFVDAARLVVTEQAGSTSNIQRKFSIGYNRAGRLMDQLEKAGIVGPAQGAKPRAVLIQDEVSLQNLISSLIRN